MSNHAKHVAPKENKRSAPKAVVEAEGDWIEEDAYDSSSRGKKKKKGARKGLVAAIVVVATLLIIAVLLYLVFGHFYNKLNYSKALSESERAAAIASYVDEPDPDDETDAENTDTDELTDLQASIQEQLAAMGGSKMSDKDVINILLVGTDARTRTERARSDVMILASLNKKTHKIILTSFMRDIYTYIPDYGYNRLNAPYAIAGPDYLIETLEDDFGVEINNYAAVNFYDFANIIDAVGGVDLTLTKAEVDFINGQAYSGEQVALGVGTGAIYLDYTDDGNYHLNGTQALAHCRNRSSAGSDYDRTERQRIVIAAMIEKAKSLSLSCLLYTSPVLLPLVTTDLTQADCLSLLLKSAEYLGYERVSLRIPDVQYSGAMINGMSVISIDFPANAKVLQDTIYN